MANLSSADEMNEQISDGIYNAAFIMDKGPSDGAAFINNECVNGRRKYLDYVLDVILNPEKKIDDLDNINWCKWLIAGGRTPDDFANIGKVNDHFTIYWRTCVF